MARSKGSVAGGGAAGDPPAASSSRDLQSALGEIDREIALHTELLRGAALTVYEPLVQEALGRIRDKAAKALLPAAALPRRVEGFSIGQPVTVTMSPPTAGLVIGSRRNQQTGEPELLLLVPGKGFVAAHPSEVTAGAPPAPPQAAPVVSSPGPLPSGPEKPIASQPGHSIHAGDMVRTPLGPGRVTAEPAAGGEVYQVEIAAGNVYHYRRNELTVIPPPAPAAPPG